MFVMYFNIKRVFFKIQETQALRALKYWDIKGLMNLTVGQSEPAGNTWQEPWALLLHIWPEIFNVYLQIIIM